MTVIVIALSEITSSMTREVMELFGFGVCFYVVNQRIIFYGMKFDQDLDKIINSYKFK